MTQIDERPPAQNLPDTAPATTAADSWKTKVLDLLVLLATPIVVLIALRVSPYFRLNNGDPFIYVGYSNAFRSHVERFGYTYHSVRFGLIFPLRMSLALGPVWGYFVLRYALYLMVIVPMWAVLRPMNRRIALLGPVIFVSSPVAAQAILTTHPDTIVVPGVAMTLCTLVLAVRSTSWPRTALLSLAAGLAAGTTLNANIFSTPLLVLMVLATLTTFVVSRRNRDAAIVAVFTLVGTLVVISAGMLTYRYMFGNANIYETTFTAMRDVSGSDIWRTPSLEWMSTRRYIYVPLFVVAFAGAALVRCWRRDRLPPADQCLIFVSVVLGLLYFVVHQFVLGGTSMEQAYYYSYLIGPVSLLTAAAVHWQGGTDRIPTWALLGFPVALAFLTQIVEIRWFIAFVGLACVLMAIMFRSRAAAAGAVTLLAMHVAWGASPRTIAPIEGAGFQYEPHYERVFGDADPTGFEAYRIGSELPGVVPSDPNYVVPMNFWYRTGDALLDSVQATYHWETSAIQRSPAPGMPSLSEGDVDRLKVLVGGYVVLLARTAPELDAGMQTLRDRGFSLEAKPTTTRLDAGGSTVYVRPVSIESALVP
jgi:hypothetical protein